MIDLNGVIGDDSGTEVFLQKREGFFRLIKNGAALLKSSAAETISVF